MKNGVLNYVFVVSLNVLVARYRMSADIKSTLNLSMKQVHHNIEKCCISLAELEIMHICPFAN